MLWKQQLWSQKYIFSWHQPQWSKVTKIQSTKQQLTMLPTRWSVAFQGQKIKKFRTASIIIRNHQIVLWQPQTFWHKLFFLNKCYSYLAWNQEQHHISCFEMWHMSKIQGLKYMQKYLLINLINHISFLIMHVIFDCNKNGQINIKFEDEKTEMKSIRCITAIGEATL